MTLFEEFINEYEPKIIESTQRLVDLMSQNYEQKAQNLDKTVEELVVIIFDVALEYEIGFAKQVLDFLEERDERTVYWDLDNNLVVEVGETPTYGTVVRPVAPYLLEFISQKGYSHGTFSGRGIDEITANLETPNKMHSFAQHISRDHVRGTKGGEGMIGYKKAELFVTIVSEGLLIDDGENVATNDPTGRILSTYENNFSSLNLYGPAMVIVPQKFDIDATFGMGF